MARRKHLQLSQPATEVSGERALNPRKSPAVFRVTLLLICGAAALYTWCALRVFQAHRQSDNRDLGSLQRATRLQPKDASNYDLVGQYYMWNVQDPGAAEQQFRQAVSLNPYDSEYWLHLAQAYSSLGEDGNEGAAIRKAIAVNPTTPDIAWNAANFFLIQGDNARALDALAVVVRNDPNMAESALGLAWRASGDLKEIESRLPAEPELYIKLIKVLIAREQWEGANQVWSALWKMNRGFDAHSVLFYVDSLLAKHDVVGAQNAWQQLLTRFDSMKLYVSPGNLVVNPGFDREILNAGFDWHYATVPNVIALLDSTQSHDGTESLLITYSGPNQDIGMFQYVPVTPGMTYNASAWVKSEELQTANGPRLSVIDGYTDVELAHSEETLGTSSWHRVTTDFTPDPNTHLVRLLFLRNPWQTQIQGRFWIDGLRLTPNGRGNSDE